MEVADFCGACSGPVTLLAGLYGAGLSGLMGHYAPLSPLCGPVARFAGSAAVLCAVCAQWLGQRAFCRVDTPWESAIIQNVETFCITDTQTGGETWHAN